MGKATGPPIFTPYERPVQSVHQFERRLPTDNGQLHFLTPAGVGDNLWIVGKLWSVIEKRECIFWLPADEQRRSGDVFRMMGLPYGYLPGLTTEWIWAQPGSPPIPDSGAVLPIQPNRHLEHGHRLEKWYPDLPFRNPVELMKNDARIYRLEAGNPKYVVAFTSQQGYMEDGGNLPAAMWARICQRLERDVAPVLLIGAGKDTDFVGKVLNFFDPTLAPALNTPLDALYSIFQGASLVIGAHAGPLILSTYMKVPTVQFMPRWLQPLAGAWEPSDAVWDWTFLDWAEIYVREGGLERFLESGQHVPTEDEEEAPLRLHVPMPVEPEPTVDGKKNGHGKAVKAAEDAVASAV